MLSITTAVRGLAARMRRVASMPLRLGMAMSMMTTSGVCSSARRILSRPSAASATTAMSGCFSSRARRPSRTTVWSSASNMRMGIASVGYGEFGHGQLGGDHGSLAELRVNAHAAAKAANPLLHAEEAHAPHESGIESHTIVAHRKKYATVLAGDRDLDGAGIAVPCRVVQSLLDEAVDASLVLVGKIVGFLAGRKRD